MKKAPTLSVLFSGGRWGTFTALPCLSPRLRSLPRRRKQSTGLFSSANYVCSLLVRVPTRLAHKKRSNILRCHFFLWWTLGDSNPRPPARQAGALPAELNVRIQLLQGLLYTIPHQKSSIIFRRMKKVLKSRKCFVDFDIDTK